MRCHTTRSWRFPSLSRYDSSMATEKFTSGRPLVNFSVAIDESYLDKEGKRQERVVWHRIVAAGKLAVVCDEYLKKGRQVFVEGRLRYAEWESNSDGRKQ